MLLQLKNAFSPICFNVFGNSILANVSPYVAVNVSTVGASGFADTSVGYVSGDTSVATVDRNGLVTVDTDAVAGTTCEITVTAVGDTSKSDSTVITVAGATG